MDSNVYSELKQSIQLKRERLNNACTTLKTEFFGIDNVIDQLVNSISAWYFFPDLQDKPVVINLWGMTGVGKTSLVKRLFELLELSDNYHRFDMGAESSGGNYWGDSISEFLRDRKGGSPIIAFDEFQHSRTIDELGQEKDQKDFRIFWELIDSGKIMVSRMETDAIRTVELYNAIRISIKQKNLKAEKGIILSGSFIYDESSFFVFSWMKGRKQYFKNGNRLSMHDGTSDENQNTPPYLVPKNYLCHIQSLASSTFNNEVELRDHLNRLDELETLDLLNGIIKEASKPKLYDYSKSLIIVMGNIDEVYKMAGEMNPDLNADEYYKITLKICLTDVKNALRKRFRIEQIARLGNNHIIYPSLNSLAYSKIIECGLNEVSTKLKEKYNIPIQFKETVNEIIYREGVFPMQGTRPVYTSIYQHIKCNISKVVLEIISKELAVDTIEVEYEKESLVFNYLSNGKTVYTFSEKLNLKVDIYRNNRQDDLQAITAVHESGHAILLALLMKTAPENIRSVSADSLSGGAVESSSIYEYTSKTRMLNNLSVFLGGYLAEKIIFGEENITIGSKYDLTRASEIAMNSIYDYGFGKGVLSIVHPNSKIEDLPRDYIGRFQNEAEKLIQDAFTLAENTLKEHRFFLLQLADYLCDNQLMDKSTFCKYFAEYMQIEPEKYFITNSKDLYYRRRLKHLLSEKSKNETIKSNCINKFSMNYSNDNDSNLK